MWKALSSISQRQSFISPSSEKLVFSNTIQETTLNSNKLGSRLREINFNNQTTEKVLQIDQHYNFTIEKNQVYGISTKYGIINYKFVDNDSSRYVQSLYFDNQMSDTKRVHLERTRQFLQDLKTFMDTGNPAYLYTARDASEVLERFESFGITTEEPSYNKQRIKTI